MNSCYYLLLLNYYLLLFFGHIIGFPVIFWNGYLREIFWVYLNIQKFWSPFLIKGNLTGTKISRSLLFSISHLPSSRLRHVAFSLELTSYSQNDDNRPLPVISIEFCKANIRKWTWKYTETIKSLWNMRCYHFSLSLTWSTMLYTYPVGLIFYLLISHSCSAK